MVFRVVERHDLLRRREGTAGPEVVEGLKVLRLNFIGKLGLLGLWEIRLSTAISCWIYLQVYQVSIIHLDVMIAYPGNLRFSRLLEHGYLRYRRLR